MYIKLVCATLLPPTHSLITGGCHAVPCLIMYWAYIRPRLDNLLLAVFWGFVERRDAWISA